MVSHKNIDTWPSIWPSGCSSLGIVVVSILSSAMAAYLEFSSMPMKLRLFFLHTTPTVPDPESGSSVVPPSGHPASRHGITRSSGNVAKWAPLNGFVAMVHTSLLRLRLSSAGLLPWDPASISALLWYVFPSVYMPPRNVRRSPLSLLRLCCGPNAPALPAGGMSLLLLRCSLIAS